ncbi:MAG: DMT family transporter [Pseudomonadota bacterium]
MGGVDQTMGRCSLQIWTSGGLLGAYAATLAFVLLASSAPAVTRFSLTHALGVLDLVMLRCSIGGLLFLPFLVARWKRLPRNLAVVGLALAFLHGWGMHLTAIAGLQFAPAGHAAALGPGFVPVWVMLWRRLWYGKWPGGLQSAGLASITLGAVVLVGYSAASGFEGRMVVGDLFFLLSSCLASAYLVYVQRHAVDPIQGAALVAVYSGIAGLLLLAWPAPSAIWTAPTSELLVQAAFQGVGMGACAILFATYATLHLGSQRFAVFVAAIPVLSLLLGRIIVGDGIHLFEAAAVVLVSAGILLAGFFAAEAQHPA